MQEFTPTWALLSGEEQHGVSWHHMDAGIDTGNILIQIPVDIAADETALSLNLKCHEAGFTGFKQLLTRLSAQTLVAQTQDLSQRSYYGYRKKPVGNGLIDWRTDASAILRTFRACQFGHHPNDFASTKVMTEQACYVVDAMTMTSASADCQFGEIVAVNPAGVRIAAHAGDIIITTVRHFNGTTFTGEDWVAQLAQAEPLALPYLNQMNSATSVHHEAWLLPGTPSRQH